MPIPTEPPFVASHAPPVEEIFVVEAYVKVEALVPVAVYICATTPVEPTTASAAYGDDVPMPTPMFVTPPLPSDLP